MADWHPGLPQRPRINSIKTWVEGSVIAFNPDDGAQIARVGGSSTYDCWSGVYGFTLDQVRLFRIFWKTTVNRGVDSFTMFDPIAGATATVEFFDKTVRPQFGEILSRPDGDGYFEVNLSFRVVG